MNKIIHISFPTYHRAKDTSVINFNGLRWLFWILVIFNMVILYFLKTSINNSICKSSFFLQEGECYSCYGGDFINISPEKTFGLSISINGVRLWSHREVYVISSSFQKHYTICAYNTWPSSDAAKSILVTLKSETPETENWNIVWCFFLVWVLISVIMLYYSYPLMYNLYYLYQRRLEECPICYETVQNSYATVTPCSHLFHYDCLLRWLKTHHFCPYCMVSLQPFFLCKMGVSFANITKSFIKWTFKCYIQYLLFVF